MKEREIEKTKESLKTVKAEGSLLIVRRSFVKRTDWRSSENQYRDSYMKDSFRVVMMLLLV